MSHGTGYGFTFSGSGVLQRVDRTPTKSGKEVITLIVSVDGQYPQLIPVKVFGKLAESAAALTPGTVVEVTGRLGGRDWNGKVYGDNVASTITPIGKAPAAAPPAAELPPQDDDVPF